MGIGPSSCCVAFGRLLNISDLYLNRERSKGVTADKPPDLSSLGHQRKPCRRRVVCVGGVHHAW